MYTKCTIQFADDGTIFENQIIKTTDEIDEKDDLIFFYGMSRDKLIKARDEHTLCEDEWFVLSVGETYDNL